MKISIAAIIGYLILAAPTTFAQGPSNGTTRGQFVDVDGGRIHFEECGEGQKAVILLHDGVVNSAVWDDVWPTFCKQFHTIRYDRRGYGGSPATTKPYYEADDLAVLLANRKVMRVALVASSHGGGIALDFALRYPESVVDLVLIGVAASGFPNSEHFIMREQANAQSDKPQDLMEASIRDPFLIVPGHDTAKKRLRSLLTASPQDLTHADMPLPEKPNFPYVRELRVPTLILIGSNDIADNQAIAGALVMAIPGATRVVVPDAGHLMYLEKPEVFSGLVTGFLKAHTF